MYYNGVNILKASYFSYQEENCGVFEKREGVEKVECVVVVCTSKSEAHFCAAITCSSSIVIWGAMRNIKVVGKKIAPFRVITSRATEYCDCLAWPRPPLMRVVPFKKTVARPAALSFISNQVGEEAREREREREKRAPRLFDRYKITVRFVFCVGRQRHAAEL